MALNPTGPNIDYYQTGRALARYYNQKPLPSDPPQGTPAWWSNQGTKDVWNGISSQTGVEAIWYDSSNQPRPVIFGTSQTPPQQPWAAGRVNIPAWCNDYWSGYLWAVQDPTGAQEKQLQGNALSLDYQNGLADGLARAAPNDPRGFVPTQAQIAQTGLFPSGILGGLPPASGGLPPGYVKGTPPAAPPPKPGGVFVPPPGVPITQNTPGLVAVTYEVYGLLRRRPADLDSVLQRTGSGYRLRRGASLQVASDPSQGFGYGGRPGSWAQLYPTVSPLQYGLDANAGVVKYDKETGHAYAIPVSDLQEMFGPDWRNQVYK